MVLYELLIYTIERMIPANISLQKLFNCYLPDCNVTSVWLENGVRPIYITYNVNYTTPYLIVHVALFILMFIMVFYGRSIRETLRSMFGHNPKRDAPI